MCIFCPNAVEVICPANTIIPSLESKKVENLFFAGQINGPLVMKKPQGRLVVGLMCAED